MRGCVTLWCTVVSVPETDATRSTQTPNHETQVNILTHIQLQKGGAHARKGKRHLKQIRRQPNPLSFFGCTDTKAGLMRSRMVVNNRWAPAWCPRICSAIAKTVSKQKVQTVIASFFVCFKTPWCDPSITIRRRGHPGQREIVWASMASLRPLVDSDQMSE